eukprot:Hpha_TRINITY_DN14614_c0_g1::TRINITY_DN14614_c0_g1_i1::g.48074::m.48074
MGMAHEQNTKIFVVPDPKLEPLGGGAAMKDAYGAVQPGLLEEDFFGGRQKILVDQQFEALEALCGYEIKNRYKVGVPDDRGMLSRGSDFLFIHEESDCCERVWCSVNRELTLFLRQGSMPGSRDFYSEQPLLMQMHKPRHCQFCCCARPSLDVTSSTGASLGLVNDPFICCTIHQDVYRPGEQQPAFQVGPVPCCQMGFCCPCCVDLNVPVFQQGKQVATLTHMKHTFCEMLSCINRMQIDFGSVKEPRDRALLFASLMLLELEYFEHNTNEGG